MTPAAVHERLAGAPMRTARLGHVEVAITFVEFELLARSGAPRGQRESAALSSRFLRAGHRPTARAIFTTSYSRQVARFAASICLSSIADEKLGVESGWRAIQRRTRNELSLSGFVFTGSSESTTHPTPRHISLAAARTSAH